LPSVFELRKEFSARLQVFNLNENRLMALPVAICQLPALRKLNLRDNQLTELPVEIGRLQSLVCLDLGRNRLSELPPEIGELRALTDLFLTDNYLIALPAKISQLRALRTLLLDGNEELYDLPSEIICLGGLARVNLEGTGMSASVLRRWVCRSMRKGCAIWHAVE
jgi:Leucine-rich repeat (LRR) protein